MAPTDLPGEGDLLERVGALLDEQRPFGVVATRVGGGDELVAGPACQVLLDRLQAVVRSVDLLAFVAPCTFVLVSDALTAEAVPHVEERLRDAVGLPVTLGEATVALPAEQASVLVAVGPAPVVVDRRAGDVPVLAAPSGAEAVVADVLGRLS